jgi:hypothetical protein
MTVLELFLQSNSLSSTLRKTGHTKMAQEVEAALMIQDTVIESDKGNPLKCEQRPPRIQKALSAAHEVEEKAWWFMYSIRDQKV